MSLVKIVSRLGAAKVAAAKALPSHIPRGTGCASEPSAIREDTILKYVSYFNLFKVGREYCTDTRAERKVV